MPSNVVFVHSDTPSQENANGSQKLFRTLIVLYSMPDENITLCIPAMGYFRFTANQMLFPTFVIEQITRGRQYFHGHVNIGAESEDLLYVYFEDDRDQGEPEKTIAFQKEIEALSEKHKAAYHQFEYITYMFTAFGDTEEV